MQTSCRFHALLPAQMQMQTTRLRSQHASSQRFHPTARRAGCLSYARGTAQAPLGFTPPQVALVVPARVEAGQVVARVWVGMVLWACARATASASGIGRKRESSGRCCA